MSKTQCILLVDDSPQDRELAMDVLESSNTTHEVIALRDGSEALDYLYKREKFSDRRTGLPSVILLDLKMPKVDGLDVLRQVKQDPGLRSIPVVVMTSSREDQDLVNSYRLGANAYVVKPVRFEDFVAAMKMVDAFWTTLNQTPRRVP